MICITSPIMLSLYAYALWLTGSLIATSAASTSPSPTPARDLDHYFGGPTSIVQFVPMNISSASFASVGGFLNQHVTIFSADVSFGNKSLEGIIAGQIDASGHYSHVLSISSGAWPASTVTTRMSCSEMSQSSLYSCVWTEQTVIHLVSTDVTTWTDATDSSSHVQSSTSWTQSTAPFITGSGTFTAGDHLYTISKAGMLRPKASISSASPSGTATSPTQTTATKSA